MVKLFTHTDLDGIGCAVLAKLVFNDAVHISYCNYDDIDKNVEKFLEEDTMSTCYITDISVSKELAEKIDKSGEKELFQLLDHHNTALYLNEYDWCNVQIHCTVTRFKTCGTELFYYYLINSGQLEKSDVLDRFVDIVRDYDTWRWPTVIGGEICKMVNDLFHLYKKDKFMDWCIPQILNGDFPKIGKDDHAILEFNQKMIDDYVDTKGCSMRRYKIAGKVAGIVFAERNFSELGNRLCTMYPDIDFIAMIDMTNKVVSYRTVKNDINLGEDIATLFGGGGHPQAAGSKISEEFITNVIKELFKNDEH